MTKESNKKEKKRTRARSTNIIYSSSCFFCIFYSFPSTSLADKHTRGAASHRPQHAASVRVCLPRSSRSSTRPTRASTAQTRRRTPGGMRSNLVIHSMPVHAHGHLCSANHRCDLRREMMAWMQSRVPVDRRPPPRSDSDGRSYWHGLSIDD